MKKKKLGVFVIIVMFGVLAFSFSFISEVKSQYYSQKCDITYNNDDFNGPDRAVDLAIDDQGNIYVTGSSKGEGIKKDTVTIKYGSDCLEKWIRRYGPDQSEDQVVAIGLDSMFNVYVAGHGHDINNDHVLFLLKYDEIGFGPGEFRWHDQETPELVDMAVDGSGNCYLAAYSPSYNYYLMKIYWTPGPPPVPHVEWEKELPHPGRTDKDIPTDIAVDKFGNIIVTGYTEDDSGNIDYLTVKFDSNGQMVWPEPKTYDGVGMGFDDEATALALDSLGNCYVAGWSNGTLTGRDYAVVKYMPNGDVAPGWPKRFYLTTLSDDEARDIAVSPSGHVFVTGTSTVEGNKDIVTIAYDSSGNKLWDEPARYNGPGNSDDEAVAIAYDNVGNCYITGSSQGDGTGLDFVTIKYNTNGAASQVLRYKGYRDYADVPTSMVVDENLNIYVTGYGTVDPDKGEDFVTIKYQYIPGWCGIGVPPQAEASVYGPDSVKKSGISNYLLGIFVPAGIIFLMKCWRRKRN